MIDSILRIIIPVITKFKLNICDPYIIKYPIPCLETKNSPMITPIKDMLILIIKVFNMTSLLPGKIKFL